MFRADSLGNKIHFDKSDWFAFLTVFQTPPWQLLGSHWKRFGGPLKKTNLLNIVAIFLNPN
jgi:hypothetical protein